MTRNGASSERTCSCKVGQLSEEYDFDINDELVARWTGESGESESVRTLSDYFNRRLLRAEMRNADIELVEGRVENLYELLTDEDRLEAVRLQAHSTLEGNGVDVDRVTDQFISHQTMYRHLRNCLGAEKGRNELSVEKERNRIHSVQRRSESVVDDAVTRLRDGGELDVDEFEVLINFRVTCEYCGTLYDITDFLDTGGCNCRR